MKIDETLKEIVNYYGSVRQVGHTHVAINGLTSTDNAIFICHNQQACSLFKPRIGDNKTIPLTTLANSSLRGYKKPLVFDNAAMFVLCQDSLNRINSLIEGNENLTNKNLELSQIVANTLIDKIKLEKENITLRNKLEVINEISKL